jgi:RNA binding exosome subunit
VKSIDIRVTAHATEDPEKVKQAVKNLLPEKLAADISFKERSLRGHYRNPITLFEARINEHQSVEDLLFKFAVNLSSFDKQYIREEPDLFINKNSLYLRFDKQAAFTNMLKIQTADPIHIRIRFTSQSRKTILETCHRFGLTQ